jgi:ribose transport system permease protein
MRIVSFIATLGMMQVARGLAKWLANNQTVVPPPTWINSLMMVDPTPAWLVFAPGIWLMLILLVVLHVLLTRTVFGRHVYAVGSSEPTARLCGVDVARCRILIFALASAFVGIGGVMQFANLTVGDPTAAVGMELDIIAAVVIGGGSLNGGEGSAFGTLIGALIMAILRNGCNMLGVPNYTQNIIVGSVIIGAAGIDSIKHRLRK